MGGCISCAVKKQTNKHFQRTNMFNLSTGSLKLIYKYQIHPPRMMVNAPLVVIKCVPYQDKADQQNRNTENTNRQPGCINNNTSPSPWRLLKSMFQHQRPNLSGTV